MESTDGATGDRAARRRADVAHAAAPERRRRQIVALAAAAGVGLVTTTVVVATIVLVVTDPVRTANALNARDAGLMADAIASLLWRALAAMLAYV